MDTRELADVINKAFDLAAKEVNRKRTRSLKNEDYADVATKDAYLNGLETGRAIALGALTRV